MNDWPNIIYNLALGVLVGVLTWVVLDILGLNRFTRHK